MPLTNNSGHVVRAGAIMLNCIIQRLELEHRIREEWPAHLNHEMIML